VATLYITEFEGRTQAHNGNASEALPLPPVAQQTVAIGAGSVLSGALGASTRYVRVIADAVCSIDVGAAPTATAAKMRLAANVPEVFSVTPGHKIAVITNT
jgi:hypothetical protein